MIELMTALAVLAILVGIAVPSMTRFAAQWRVSNAVNAFMGAMRTARTEAVARGKVVRLCRITNATATCKPAKTTDGFVSGWILYVDTNNDADYKTSDKDVLLLQQNDWGGMAGIIPDTDSVDIAFMPSGIMRGTDGSNKESGLGVEFRASQYVDAASTPWAVRGVCVRSTGIPTVVAKSADCVAGTNK